MQDSKEPQEPLFMKKPKSLWEKWTTPKKRLKMSSFYEIEKACIKRMSKDICNEVDRMIINDMIKNFRIVHIKTYWDADD